jgi:hypothetical protein
MASFHCPLTTCLLLCAAEKSLKRARAQEATEAEEEAKKMGLGADFFEGGGPRLLKGKGKGKGGQDGAEVPSALAMVIGQRQQQREQAQDSFLDSLAAKYAKPAKTKAPKTKAKAPAKKKQK